MNSKYYKNELLINKKEKRRGFNESSQVVDDLIEMVASSSSQDQKISAKSFDNRSSEK